METLFGDIEFYAGTKGHADVPGTGPVGETCGTCGYYTRVEYHDKTYRKCGPVTLNRLFAFPVGVRVPALE